MGNEIIKTIILVVVVIAGLAALVKSIGDVFNDKQYEPRIVGNAKYVSTRDTIFMQYISVFITAFAFAASVVFFYDWHYVSKYKYNTTIGIIFLILSFATLFINRISSWASIAVIDNKLLIAGILKKYEMSFKEIDRIENTTLKPPNRLTIYFKDKTKFGNNVSFFPVNNTIEGELLALLKKYQNEVD